MSPPRTPTPKQYELLRVLAGGAMILTPRRREWSPLLRRGWVAPDEDDGEKPGPYLAPLRITPDGLRALALAVERYGLPDLGPRRKPLPEPPVVTRLRRERDDARAERDVTGRDLARVRAALARMRQQIDSLEDPQSSRRNA